ncbi:PREDICTED: cilia- and flagella-associated protein 45-like [Nicrophorus vespilloides]|uniref:Cilia- and flagella-associated protein 45 n=1 Tax=Nicrophorus vespilloides TaxID=110193 RepID=A0ABM1N1M1_NICVS|nr:PREDICTED: cilia- and flagella-associated protein 45-like [Nicrophorus vespilloides]
MLKANQKKSKNKAPGDHEPAECDHTIHGEFIHHKPKTAKENKELVRIRQQKDIRDIIVPCRQPLEIPRILPASEFQRLKKQSYVVTAAERKAIFEENERKKMQLRRESEQRKEKMKNLQQTQTATKGSTLEKVESDAKRKNMYLLQRAFEMQQEQEDEIKNVNSIILASKCLAIREAQIAEKNLIKREIEEEENRLDMMMEQERQRGLLEEQKKRDKEAERTQTFVTQIQQQIKEIEIQNLIEAEHKEEEARNINLALVAMQQEERDRQRQKMENRLKIRADMKQANDDMENYRALQREEERLADARLKEFMKQKHDREAAIEAEIKANKAAKEREIARLTATQAKAADLQALRDEMNAYRVHEETEREWRKKEKEGAIKKKEMLAQLKRDREQQIEDIRKAQAAELARDEEEFLKVAQMQYEIFAKEQEKHAEKKRMANQYRKEILKQVNERESERIDARKTKLEEGNALRLEDELRRVRINDTLERKLRILRRNNVPEQAITDVQRQIKTRLSKTKAK